MKQLYKLSIQDYIMELNMKKFFIFIILLYFNCLLYAQVCEKTQLNDIKGQFINGDKFYGKYIYCRLNKPDEDKISRMDFSLNIEGKENSYIYLGGINPSIEVSNLGVISIFDKFGGMESPARITYLGSIDKELVKLGEVNLNYSQGQVVNYSNQSVYNGIDLINSIILTKKQPYFINNTPLSYPDYFILLLSNQTLKNKTNNVWIEQFYTKLRLLQHQDIINIYSQNVFFKKTTLCKKNENEKDAFGCKVKNKQLSVCYNYAAQNLLYRFGSQSKIELELVKEITDEDKKNKMITFTNNGINYIINTEQGKEGIRINKQDITVKNYKCEPNTIEPMILDSFN